MTLVRHSFCVLAAGSGSAARVWSHPPDASNGARRSQAKISFTTAFTAARRREKPLRYVCCHPIVCFPFEAHHAQLELRIKTTPPKRKVLFRYDPPVLIISLSWSGSQAKFGRYLHDRFTFAYVNNESFVSDTIPIGQWAATPNTSRRYIGWRFLCTTKQRRSKKPMVTRMWSTKLFTTRRQVRRDS